MKYKNLLFDCDGTLLDTSKTTIASYNAGLMKLYNRVLTKEEEEEVFHRTHTENMKVLKMDHDQEIDALIHKIYLDMTERIDFFTNMKEALENLKSKGIHMGMVTNRDRSMTLKAYEKFGFDKYFNDYVCVDDVNTPKPSGEMITHYLKKHGLNPEETIYLGNGPTDHLEAQRSGIDYAYCMWGTTSIIKEIHIALYNVNEILELIQTRNTD